MKKVLGGLMLGIMTVTFVADVPSGYAIMGSRIAMAIATRRAAKKMAKSEEAEKGTSQAGEKAVGPGNGYAGDASANSENAERQV